MTKTSLVLFEVGVELKNIFTAVSCSIVSKYRIIEKSCNPQTNLEWRGETYVVQSRGFKFRQRTYLCFSIALFPTTDLPVDQFSVHGILKNYNIITNAYHVRDLIRIWSRKNTTEEKFDTTTPCSLLTRYQRFGETSCFHVQG